MLLRSVERRQLSYTKISIALLLISLVGVVAHEIVSDRKDSNTQHWRSVFRLITKCWKSESKRKHPDEEYLT
jgi:hypothetical protein